MEVLSLRSLAGLDPLRRVASLVVRSLVIVAIAISLAVGFESRVVLPLAIAASSAMCLPIATPPNALVFATGRLKAEDFIRPGLLIGAIAPVLGVLWVLVLR